MSNFESTLSTQTSVEPVKDSLVQLLEHPRYEARDDLRNDAVHTRQEHQELVIAQGEVSGKVERESLAYSLGSLASSSTSIHTETQDGTEDVRLQTKELQIIPTSTEYAQMDVGEAFDWDLIMKFVRETRGQSDAPLYLVVFRSKLKPEADVATLLEHDKRAHDAALASPALIHYFGGEPNENGEALSFCLWEDAESAKTISKDRRHTDAAKMVSSYESYSVEKYNVSYIDGEVVFSKVGA